MFGQFNEDARMIIARAKKEMYELKHPYVGSEHLLLALLKEDNSISKKLKEYNIDYDSFKKELLHIIGMGSKESNWFLYTASLKRILENAIIDSKENNGGIVTVEHLFSSLLEEGEGVAIRILLSMNVDLDLLYNEFALKVSNTAKGKKNKKLLLEELGIDLTEKARKQELDPVIGREEEMNRILEILLRRNKNNPILIGEPGVGKTALVEELARRIVDGEVPYALRNKRIISLDMATTVAGTKYRGEFEERIRKILKEIEENDQIILFIDEIHTLVGAGGAEGAIDASNIFKPALARGKLRCIGATTISEYKKYIEEDGALARRFQKVLIEEPNREDIKNILNKLKDIYGKYHRVEVSDEIIDEIIDLTTKYIYDRNQPDASIDILDEVCASVSLRENKDIKKYNALTKQVLSLKEEKNESILHGDFKKASLLKIKENEYMDKINHLEMEMYTEKKVVKRQDLAHVISLKTKIPVYEILKDNKKIISKISRDLHENILGQEEIIEKLIQVVKRIKLGFNEEKKVYSLFFCGPSGVGKTALAKRFGKNLVGNNVIRLDMSEYSEAHSVSKFVGSPPGYVGYADNRNILEEIRNKPYSVLILDEIERAHPNIINLLFQILDEGKIKDSKGNIVRFDHVTLIFTSNIGFEEKSIGFQAKKEKEVITKLKESFSVPFMNRIDSIFVFHSLKEDVIQKLITDKLNGLKRNYKKKNINVRISNAVCNQLLKKTDYKEFGARKIDKLIKDEIENFVIEEILENKTEIYVKNLRQELSV